MDIYAKKQAFYFLIGILSFVIFLYLTLNVKISRLIPALFIFVSVNAFIRLGYWTGLEEAEKKRRDKNEDE